MGDEDRDETEIVLDGEPLDLDAETGESLEDAVREALAAVEDGREAVVSEEVEAEAEDFHEKWLRALADLDNYRKRVDRERAEERRYRSLEVLREVLVIGDNLRRALEAGGGVDDLKAGIEMIGRQLDGLLGDFGVRRVPSVGQPFDPTVHEAVSRHEDLQVDRPTVSEELQAGYLMHDRLLRPAMVSVAMPVTAAERSKE
jgi:molecular chaperone GrpE